ncbi:hypothetical protein [Herbidospora cretacea]|uniref:hypothetical protein n=1 Tax=Herbidospora cretacea TaxID=28444 RepID=UPI0007732043|nr:hypothetical protein [Herbidospora cretacea]
MQISLRDAPTLNVWITWTSSDGIVATGVVSSPGWSGALLVEWKEALPGEDLRKIPGVVTSRLPFLKAPLDRFWSEIDRHTPDLALPVDFDWIKQAVFGYTCHRLWLDLVTDDGVTIQSKDGPPHAIKPKEGGPFPGSATYLLECTVDGAPLKIVIHSDGLPHPKDFPRIWTPQST